MSLFEIAALLITLAAVFSYVNHRWLRLPTTIGLMVMAMLLSVLILLSGLLLPGIADGARDLLSRVDFNETLMHGMLGFLLFAGALHVELDDLVRQKGTITVLATVGVVISTVVVAAASLVVARLLHLPMRPVDCLLFGALISPTDPIAVIGLLKDLGAPRSLATKIAGESLFNDGIGVVVFLALVGVAVRGHFNAVEVLELFLVESVGGVLFGLAIGYLAYLALKSVDRYQVEVLISLALVTGGFALAEALHVSAPIAMVVAGLMIGNQGRALAMSETTRHHLDSFWELVDEILNAVLFVLIGLEVLVLSISGRTVAAAMLAVPVALLARFVAVGLPVGLLRSRRDFTPHAVKVMTWGGLRGGISVALALGLGAGLGVHHPPTRETIVVMTYAVVAFSIVAQGLSIGPLIRRLGLASEPPDGSRLP